MLGARLNFCSSVSAPGSSIDQSTSINPIRNPQSQCSYRFPPQASSLNFLYSVRVKPLPVTRGQSEGRFCPKALNEAGADYLGAAVMMLDSIKHYQLLVRGFPEESVKELKGSLVSLRLGFLRQFKSPTIFLKISNGGDFLLPIVVGDFALQRLMESAIQGAREFCSNHYDFTRNLASQAGYQVSNVKITAKVGSTYIARIYFSNSKSGKKGEFSIDARPSDAINVALRCKAQIYVSKKIVMDDGIRMTFKTSRLLEPGPCIDPVLDRRPKGNGKDLLVEELNVVKNMNLAIKEERYDDAAMWQQKLLNLHEPESES